METQTSESIGKAYHDEGYVSPITVMSPGEAGELRRQLETIEQSGDAGTVKSVLWNNTHYAVPFAYDLIHRPEIVAAARAVLGDDLMCWSTGFFIKEPGDEKFISWHQDLHYWGLEGGEEVTAWLAFAPSTVESGCMRVIPGSHRVERAEHADTWGDDNLLSRGQAILDVDEDQAVDMELEPGQISLHHGKTFHASRPNLSDDRRIGFTIRYITPAMYQTKADRDWACLVHGEDPHGHFQPFKRPAVDLDPADVAFHQMTTEELHNVFYG